MSPSLPRTIILKSSYVDRRRRTTTFCVLHCNQRDTYKNIHLCNKDDIASPHAKFQLVRVNPDKGLYRIKCCYNNKLWSSSNSGFIQATENEDAGDATLFRIEPVDAGNNKYRLMCMEPQLYVCFDYSALYTERDWVLKVDSMFPRNDSHDVFTVVNWESLVILPKDVAFLVKRKKNEDEYEEGYVFPKPFPNDGKYHLYASTTDIGDRRVAHEIVTLSDQKIGVKNNFSNHYWTYDDSYYKIRTLWQYKYIFLVAGSDDTSKPDSQFLPIKIGDDRKLIALRNVDTGTLCYRHGDEFVLSDDKDRTIFEEAKIKVEELVVSRKVYDVDFRFDDSCMIYNENVENVSDHTTNYQDTDAKKELKLEYKEAISSSYDTGVSVKTISGFSLEATLPIIEDKLSFTPSAEFTTQEENKYSWGEATETTFKIGVVLSVTVPPKSQVTAKMEATKAKCDISFSYKQRDLTTRGEHVVETKDDGIYTCTNCYNFNIIIKEQPITS